MRYWARRWGVRLFLLIFVFIVAIVFLLALSVVLRSPWPSYKDLAGLPVMAWLGGILGAFYVSMLVLCVPRIGVGFSTALVVCGQLAMGVICDHFGFFGMPQTKFSFMRAVAMVLIAISVGILQFVK